VETCGTIRGWNTSYLCCENSWNWRGVLSDFFFSKVPCANSGRTEPFNGEGYKNTKI
jgi:hypothetical protein